MYFQMKATYTDLADIQITEANTVFLGQSVKSKQELRSAYQKLIFFSYRSFKYPIGVEKEEYHEDTCTLLLMKFGAVRSAAPR
jgi:hypothetical protein